MPPEQRAEPRTRSWFQRKPTPEPIHEGVDLSSLWDEPEEAGSLGTILAVVNTVMLVLTLAAVFFKH